MKNVIQIIWDFLNTPIFKGKGDMIKLIIDEPGYTLLINGKEFRTPGFAMIPQVKLNDVVRYLKSQGVAKYRFIAEPDINIKNQVRDIHRNEHVKISNEGIIQKETTVVINQTDPEISKKLDRLEALISKIAEKEPSIIQQIISSEDGIKPSVKKKKDDVNTFIPSVNTSDLQLKVSGSKTLENEKTDVSGVEALSKLKKKG